MNKVFGGAGGDDISIEGSDYAPLGDTPVSKLSEVYGEAGNDTIWGGDNGDTIQGGADDDNLVGWRGNDIMYGGYGAGDGNDVLDPGADADFAYGYGGNDTFTGSVDGAVDWLDGGTGTDVVGVDGVDYNSGQDSLFNFP